MTAEAMTMRLRRLLLRVAATLCLLAAIASAASTETDGCTDALDRGDFQQASQTAEKLVRLHPASAAVRVLLARAYMGLDKPQGALGELHRALRLDPNSQDALYYLSKLTAVLSRQEFVALAEMAPDSARVHQIHADGLDAKGDVEGAEREYLAALDKRPGTASLMNALGDLKRHNKQFNEALEWYQRVLDKNPDNYDALYGAGACHLLSRSSPAAAVPLFRRALKADPSSLAAKLALGEALLVSGGSDEAVALLEAAAKANPELQRIQYLLARAYQSAGRPADARRAFQRYRELSPSPGETDPLPPEGRQ